MARRVHGTLVATVVATVNLDPEINSVEVLNRSGTAEIYFSTDGTAPTVGGDFYVLPAVVSSVVVRTTSEQVKLISAGTPSYSVTADPL